MHLEMRRKAVANAGAALFLVAGTVFGQTAPVQPPQDPLSRTSPQSAILAFLDTCHAKDYRRAAHYLDLSQIAEAQRTKEGPELAQDLEQILNRDAQFDVASLSRQPEGDDQDTLPPNREHLVSVSAGGKTGNLQLERTALRPGLSVWRVAPDSVVLIPALAAATSESPIERHLPALMVNSTVLETPLWRWLALALWAAAAWALSRLASLLVHLLAPLFNRFRAQAGAEALIRPFVRPVRLLLFAGVFGAGMQWIDPSAVVRLYLSRTLELISVLGLVWLAAGIVDIAATRVHGSLSGSDNTVSRSALPLVSRVVKLLILFVGLIGVLSSWGYNTGTLLAGLGIGGVAVALAAQKTIENLFGSVAVVGDRPVYVGEFCKFGDSLGTVEDIGLRSTRIRTVDRTLLTVPNGQFSSMTLENSRGGTKCCSTLP